MNAHDLASVPHRAAAGRRTPAALPSTRRQRILTNLLRVGLSGLLVATGIGKLLDVPGFVGVIGTYQLGLSDAAMQVAAWVVVIAELLVGTWLLVARRLAAPAAAAALINTGYLVLLTDALRRGLTLSNCGCFGVYFPSPLTWWSPVESLVTVLLCVWLWRLSRRQPRS